MKHLVSVAWICRTDNSVLCVKTTGKDKYFIPGGKLAAGETDEAALIREIREELNVALIPATIRYAFSVSDMAYGLSNTALEMRCYNADFDGELVPESEIESMRWLDLSTIELCAPAAQKALRKILQ